MEKTPGLGLYSFSRGFGEFLTDREEEIYWMCRIMNHFYSQVYPSPTPYPRTRRCCCCCLLRWLPSSVRPSSSSLVCICSLDNPANINNLFNLYNICKYSHQNLHCLVIISCIFLLSFQPVLSFTYIGVKKGCVLNLLSSHRTISRFAEFTCSHSFIQT